MKNLVFVIVGLIMLPHLYIKAQDTLNLTYALVSQLNIYVFPAQGQSKEQQEKDISECYEWAVQQTGVNPLNPPKVEADQVETGPDGSAVRGAAKGAAVGAAAGGMAGRRAETYEGWYLPQYSIFEGP